MHYKRAENLNWDQSDLQSFRRLKEIDCYRIFIRVLLTNNSGFRLRILLLMAVI